MEASWNYMELSCTPSDLLLSLSCGTTSNSIYTLSTSRLIKCNLQIQKSFERPLVESPHQIHSNSISISRKVHSHSLVKDGLTNLFSLSILSIFSALCCLGWWRYTRWCCKINLRKEVEVAWLVDLSTCCVLICLASFAFLLVCPPVYWSSDNQW